MFPQLTTILLCGAGLLSQDPGSTPHDVLETEVSLDMIDIPAVELLRALPAFARYEVKIDVQPGPLDHPLRLPNYRGTLRDLLSNIADRTGVAFYVKDTPQQIMIVATEPSRVPPGVESIWPGGVPAEQSRSGSMWIIVMVGGVLAALAVMIVLLRRRKA